MTDGRYQSPHTQPCWNCRNYIGACPWTRVDPDTGRVCFEPVPGWVAVPRERMSNGAKEGGLVILSCPQYQWDGTGEKHSPRRWINEVVLSLFRAGKSCREVAEITGMSKSNASYHHNKLIRAGELERKKGIRAKKKSPWTARQVLELFLAGKSCREVAELTGMSENTAEYYRRRFREEGALGEFKRGRKPGRESPWTAEVVLSLFRAGRSCAEVARETGMDKSTARYYRKKFRLAGDLEG